MTEQKQLANVQKSIEKHLIGQKDLIEGMLVCLLCDGHLLIEGMPGLAKTTAAKALANSIEGEFHRVQFTPDLLPSDLIGTDIYVHEKSDFTFRKGPLFHNILLADEINRAPAKVQSALLEAMEEKQVTVGAHTYALPKLFMVLATQNPIEQEGSYKLPEAQLDRFLMHLEVKYPTDKEELEILSLDENRQRKPEKAKKSLTHQSDIFAARQEIAELYMDHKLKNYIISLVAATRTPKPYSDDLTRWILCGGSPRASIAISRCAKALAWLRGDEYVSPYHIQTVAPNVLRHRLILTFEAESEEVTKSQVIQHLLEVVAVP
ncbi:MAG: MoxR family ATPase [Alphaproteobacteria bacterium]|nr:MoxR family ATPase [Alphaproteobacteria bacterium]